MGNSDPIEIHKDLTAIFLYKQFRSSMVDR